MARRRENDSIGFLPSVADTAPGLFLPHGETEEEKLWSSHRCELRAEERSVQQNTGPLRQESTCLGMLSILPVILSIFPS